MAGSITDTYDLTIDLDGSCATDPSKVVAGRYVVKEAIGAGRFGSVWRALDQVREVDVALKIVPANAPSDLDHLRRELTALRWLRLPGVARMRDEGIDGNRWFIVMDLVEGKSFPGLPNAEDWALLWPRAEALLEVLVRLHAARIVHRDLKPANVMADTAGRVTIVDFGIASGRAGIAAPEQRFVGTPRYASPEQCAGRATGPRSDLYSVGVMLYEALVGDVPHQATTYAQLLQRRREEPAPSLSCARPDLPAAVVHVIDAMLQRNPRDRPSTAQVVLDRLRGPGWRTSVVGPPFDPERQYSWSSLKQRFHGPDRFLHLQTDAARELWRRTAGQPTRLRQELEAWVRAGLVHLDGERMRISRRALDQLADGLRVDPTRIPPADDSAEQTIADRVRIAFPHAHEDWVLSRSGLSSDRFQATVRRMREAGRLWSVRGRWFCGAELNPVPHWKTIDQQAMLTDLTTWASDRGLGGTNPGLRLPKTPGPIIAKAADVASELVRDGDHRKASALIRLALARSTPLD
ncbi:MAG: serine/threonine-protein kinase, partial [Myxococcota bacterium]